MSNELSFFVLAYYCFTPIEDPHSEVKKHKTFFNGRNMTSRIYISEQGINGQASGIREDAESYMQWMQADYRFKDVHFKIHPYHENVFPRQTIKYRAQLVAVDEEVDLADVGEHVSPKQWKKLLESDAHPLVLDVRNDYEWQVGRFQNAECPPCKTFREFGQYAHDLKQKVDPANTPVMMYCTGGIRCELYSSVLRKNGFKNVYQLDGGIINYGLQQGADHWLGKLFVFDDRLTVPISEEKTPIIGQCYLCDTAIENYYNCANMDCNRLFLCCPICLAQRHGCCSEHCQQSPKVRPYHHQDAHKPFRKWYNYFSDKESIA